MGRRSERLGRPAGDAGGESDVIQVVSRAFEVMRCFGGHDMRLGNLEIANRCRLPRSTVSRLTHTLTRMGQLVYLPQDQKYRLGPGAIAMSTAMMRGLRFRGLVRMLMDELAQDFPGTVGFVAPDRFHMVYLECARTHDAVGLQSTTGSRIDMARTASGHAYTAALDPDVCAGLLAEMDREIPDEARLLKQRLDGNRRALRENGYVISSGLWNPHITGISVPLWSPHYRDYLVLTIGLLAAMYDEQRLKAEVAPRLLQLAQQVLRISDSADDNPFVEPVAMPQRRKTAVTAGVGGSRRELEAAAGRARAAAAIRAADVRRREVEAG
jgi:DNA-binding IclR family transcriptional regulator